MHRETNIRWGWLKGMYIYTIAGAGGFGLGIIVIPDVMCSIFGWPGQDRFISFGVAGSVYLAFALVSILGLRSPLKFSPILLLQLVYKVIWFVGVIFPAMLKGEFPAHASLYAAIYATYIVGDLIAIPFPYVFAKHSE